MKTIAETFHELWGIAAGNPGYDKEKWKALQGPVEGYSQENARLITQTTLLVAQRDEARAACVETQDDLAALRERLAGAEVEGLTPIRWMLGEACDGAPEQTIDLARRIDGKPRYAVRQGRSCLSLAGQWDYEPMPSDREDCWLDAHRFDTLKEAAAALAAWREGGGR